MKRIFISYSRTDRDFARRLAKSLAELGADVWIDYEDIPAGKKWSTAIQQGLDSSDGMLVLVSPESMASSNVEDEWQYFLDSGRPVIPILYKPAKFHFQLHRLQYVDFAEQRFGDAFAKLLDELSAKGISLMVESAEDTWIYDVKVRSKPPKKELEYIADSKKETMPSFRLRKPVLEKTRPERAAQAPNFLLAGIGLLVLALLVIGILLSLPYLQ
jgi:hypothetical protein